MAAHASPEAPDGGTIHIPAGIVAYFVWHRQRYSAAVTLFWVAQSLFNVSVYVKDARAQALPLLGGEDTLRDWGYLLGRLTLLSWDHALGNMIYTVGLVTLGASVLWGFSCSKAEEPSAP